MKSPEEFKSMVNALVEEKTPSKIREYETDCFWCGKKFVYHCLDESWVDADYAICNECAKSRDYTNIVSVITGRTKKDTKYYSPWMPVSEIPPPKDGKLFFLRGKSLMGDYYYHVIRWAKGVDNWNVHFGDNFKNFREGDKWMPIPE